MLGAALDAFSGTESRPSIAAEASFYVVSQAQQRPHKVRTHTIDAYRLRKRVRMSSTLNFATSPWRLLSGLPAAGAWACAKMTS